MFKKIKQGNRITYDYYEFIVDEKEDIKNLPRSPMGSSALVIRTGNIYLADSNGDWYSFTSTPDKIECNCKEESTIWVDMEEQ